MIRMAIVGVGWAGTRQARAVRELGKDVTVECLVDNDPDHLKAKAKELEIRKTYPTIDQALADSRVDAVSICTPHHLHHDLAIRAAECGRHVLCEKPLALNVAEATRMINACHQAGVRLYVAENASYTPMARFLREVVASGNHVGEVVAASVVKGFRGVPYGYPGRREWLATPELGGTGTWMLHGIHTVAQLRFVFGEMDTVYAGEHHADSFGRSDIEGTVHGLLTTESGFRVSLVQTCEVRLKGPLSRYVIHGDRGSIWAWDDGCRVYQNDDKGDEPQWMTYPKSELSDYALELEAFAAYVNGETYGDDASGQTTGRSERRSLAVVQAGYESMQSGEPVRLAERFPGI